MKGRLMTAVHGRLESGGDPASLLIFEFYLTTTKGRFTKSTITVTFEDGSGQSDNDPEVYNLAPSGEYALNKATDSRDVTHGLDATLNANPIPAVGGSLGYHWTMTKAEHRSHSAKLNGMSRRLKIAGEENAAMWVMEEDLDSKEGIPTFLRTVIVLRHDPDECGEFRFSLKIEAMEKREDIKFFFSSNKPFVSQMMQPLSLDPKVFVGIKKEGVNPNELGKLCLDNEFIVRLAKILSV